MPVSRLVNGRRKPSKVIIKIRLPLPLINGSSLFLAIVSVLRR